MAAREMGMTQYLEDSQSSASLDTVLADDAQAVADTTELLLIVRVGAQRLALPVAAVERVLPMAALVSLPDSPPGVAGLLGLSGELLPVVDLWHWCSLPTPKPHPAQQLVLLRAATTFVVWVAEAEQVFTVSQQQISTVTAPDTYPTQYFQFGDEHCQIVAPARLDPGPFVQQAQTGEQQA
jgi:chemotaxis signal transduction protein